MLLRSSRPRCPSFRQRGEGKVRTTPDAVFAGFFQTVAESVCQDPDSWFPHDGPVMSRDVVNLDSTESQPTPAIVPVGIDAVGLLCGAEQSQRARIRFRHVLAIGSGTCRPDLPEGARQEPALDKGAIVPFDFHSYPVAEPRRLGAHVLPSVTTRRHLDVAQMKLETEAPFTKPLSQ